MVSQHYISSIARLFASLSACSILTISTVGPGYAAAQQDGKFYPGTMCKIAEEDHEHRNELRYGKFGFVVNQDSRERVRVVCSIIRDEMNTNRGVSVRVFIHDSNPNDRLACELIESAVWGDQSSELDRAETPDFIVQKGPRKGQNLGSLCNTGVADEFGSGENAQRVNCSLGLKTDNSGKWDRSEPGSGLHMICGLPARTTTGEFSGRSGIGGYYVEETTQ